MRMARIKVRERTAAYHCISRIVGGQLLLEDFCKERFRRMMWREARFCGIQILTYCLMANHVHPSRFWIGEGRSAGRRRCGCAT